MRNGCIALAIFAALLLTGCDLFGQDEPDRGMFGGPLDLAGGVQEMVLAAEGATLTTETGIRAVIPPDALPEDMEVMMVPVEVNDNDGQRVVGVRFGPEGTILNRPVTISFPWDEPAEPHVLAFKGDDPRNAINTYAYGLERTPGRLDVLVSHFSGVVCAKNCHAGTIQHILSRFEARGCSRDEALNLVREQFPGVEVPDDGCGGRGVETVQSFLDTYFDDIGGFDAGRPVPSALISEMTAAVQAGREVVVAFKPGAWGNRSGANNFLPTGVMDYAHTAALEIKNGTVQIRNTLATSHSGLISALGGENVVHFPLSRLNEFRDLPQGVATELQVCGVPDCLSDTSKNEFELDVYHPVAGQSYAGRAWSDPFTYLFSEGEWSGIEPRSVPWNAVRVYVEKAVTVGGNPCDPPEIFFEADIDVPGYRASIDVRFLAFGLGSSGNQDGFPTILVGSDPSGLFTNGDYFIIGFPKVLPGSNTFTFNISSGGPVDGFALLGFSTPQIRNEDDGSVVSFGSISGSVTFTHFGVQTGDRIAGAFSVNLEGDRTRVVNGEDVVDTLRGTSRGSFDGIIGNVRTGEAGRHPGL